MSALEVIVKFDQNCEIWSKLWSLVKIEKFGLNCDICSKLWNLVNIVKFGRNCEIWSKSGFIERNVSRSCIIYVKIVKIGKELWKFEKIVKVGLNCENWSLSLWTFAKIVTFDITKCIKSKCKVVHLKISYELI